MIERFNEAAPGTQPGSVKDDNCTRAHSTNAGYHGGSAEENKEINGIESKTILTLQ